MITIAVIFIQRGLGLRIFLGFFEPLVGGGGRSVRTAFGPSGPSTSRKSVVIGSSGGELGDESLPSGLNPGGVVEGMTTARRGNSKSRTSREPTAALCLRQDTEKLARSDVAGKDGDEVASVVAEIAITAFFAIGQQFGSLH